jgi:RNA-directed DNA polymerase
LKILNRMSHLTKLKNATSIGNLALLLDSKTSVLAYHLFKVKPDDKYRKFLIPKKSGGERIINAPNDKLKEIQRKLANILYNCATEIEKQHSPRKKPLSHGFKKKIESDSNKNIVLGIHSNASCHRNSRYVLNLDLADFFPAFNFGRVRGFFMSNNDFKLEPKIATLIAQIACNQNELPQGSPSFSMFG